MSHIQNQANVFVRNGVNLCFSIPRNLNKIGAAKNGKLMRDRRLAHPHVFADMHNTLSRLQQSKKNFQTCLICQYLKKVRHRAQARRRRTFQIVFAQIASTRFHMNNCSYEHIIMLPSICQALFKKFRSFLTFSSQPENRNTLLTFLMYNKTNTFDQGIYII